jgi:hypothetical protein
MGWDSSVGITTGYGLGGPGIESPWGARFSVPVQTCPGAHPAFYTMGTGSIQWDKAAGAWRGPPTPFSAEVEGRVELCIFSPSGPLLVRTLPLLLLLLNVTALFLPSTSPLEPTAIPTAQSSSFTLQYFPYYVCCSKYTERSYVLNLSNGLLVWLTVLSLNLLVLVWWLQL